MDRTYITGSASHRHLLFLSVFFFIIVSSCQKDETGNPYDRGIEYKSEFVKNDNSISYIEPETYTIISGDSLKDSKSLANKNYRYFEKFILTVQNGNSRYTSVEAIEVLIDGVGVVNGSDFRNSNIVSKELTGLNESSVLGIRLKGSAGTFVKVQIECSLQDDVISDVDSNYYHTVQIGSDRWMSENLKTTRYNDGTPLEYLTDGTLWDDMSESDKGYYCFYNDDEASKETYGAMYSLRAAAPVWNEDKNICPEGWHVASFNDFWDMIRILEPGVVYVDDIRYAGAGLKESGTSHWQVPNSGATDKSGFNALPGGIRYKTSSLSGRYGSWWLGYGEGFGLKYDNTAVYHWWDSYDGGHSVRCVEDRPESKAEIIKLFKYPGRSHSGLPELK
jgi:uncharacterized protein (TIGR02145 family)